MSCGDAGFLGPGVGCSFLESNGHEVHESGDGADAVDRGGEFLCLGPGSGNPQDQVAGSFDQAGRSVQQPVAQGRRFGLGERAVQ